MTPGSENPTFSIRPAAEDDLDSILMIEKASYRLPWTKEAFLTELAKPFCRLLVMTDDDTDSVLTGYIVFWLIFDDCHILNVAVHPEWRGLGVGARLVRQAVKEAISKGQKRVFLEVRKSNDGAVALYQKLGFFIEHVKKRFYEDGEDAYFMVLYLDGAPVPDQKH